MHLYTNICLKTLFSLQLVYILCEPQETILMNFVHLSTTNIVNHLHKVGKKEVRLSETIPEMIIPEQIENRRNWFIVNHNFIEPDNGRETLHLGISIQKQIEFLETHFLWQSSFSYHKITQIYTEKNTQYFHTFHSKWLWISFSFLVHISISFVVGRLLSTDNQWWIFLGQEISIGSWFQDEMRMRHDAQFFFF